MMDILFHDFMTHIKCFDCHHLHNAHDVSTSTMYLCFQCPSAYSCTMYLCFQCSSVYSCTMYLCIFSALLRAHLRCTCFFSPLLCTHLRLLFLDHRRSGQAAGRHQAAQYESHGRTVQHQLLSNRCCRRRFRHRFRLQSHENRLLSCQCRNSRVT